MKNITTNMETMIALYQKGLKNREIAETLGIHKTSLPRLLRKAGIAPRPHKIDMVGFRSGKLTVIEESTKHHSRESRWRCQCDCGKFTITLGSKLRNGVVKSCGCLFKDSILKGVVSTNAKSLFYSYVRNAANRGLEFTLTPDLFHELTQQNCYYCGQKPNQTKTLVKNSIAVFWNGIDRMDNTIGYTKENSVTCCKDCNMGKRSMSVEEFKAWVSMVYQHSITQNATITADGSIG